MPKNKIEDQKIIRDYYKRLSAAIQEDADCKDVLFAGAPVANSMALLYDRLHPSSDLHGLTGALVIVAILHLVADITKRIVESLR